MYVNTVNMPGSNDTHSIMLLAVGNTGGGIFVGEGLTVWTLLFVGLLLIGSVGGGLTLSMWLLFVIDKCCIISHAKSLRRAQNLVVIGARPSVSRMHRSALYDSSKLLVGKQTGLGVNRGALAHSNNFFV